MLKCFSKGWGLGKLWQTLFFGKLKNLGLAFWPFFHFFDPIGLFSLFRFNVSIG